MAPCYRVHAGQSYRIIEGSVFETSDLVNLFPSPEDPSLLTPGKVRGNCDAGMATVRLPLYLPAFQHPKSG